MDRYEIFDPASFQPYGTADELELAVVHALEVAPARWVVIDSEYGRVAASGVGGCRAVSSAEMFAGDRAGLAAHLRSVHGWSALAFADAGDPDYEGLAAWHYEIHLGIDSTAPVY